jgi:DNA-binding XRE family transcriptional regulator
MRRQIAVPKRLIEKEKYNQKLSMKDVIICVLSIPLGYLISTFFVGIFQGIFLVMFPLTVYFLISPSEVYEKKNFQVIFRAFYKTRGVYHPIHAPKEENSDGN